MKTEKYKIYFLHILEAIEKLELVASTTTKEEFLNDWLRQDAVLKISLLLVKLFPKLMKKLSSNSLT